MSDMRGDCGAEANYDSIKKWFDELTVNEARDVLERLSVVTEDRGRAALGIGSDDGA